MSHVIDMLDESVQLVLGEGGIEGMLEMGSDEEKKFIEYLVEKVLIGTVSNKK